MDKKEREKIRNIAKGYLKQKSLKDKIKFVAENPITEEKEKFNLRNFMKGRFGIFLIGVSLFLVSWFSAALTTEHENGWFLIAIPLYVYLLIKMMDF